MDASTTVLALGALAHEARLAVFKLLVQSGPNGLAAGIIAERLEMAPPALSFHLKELTRTGLLLQRPEGRKIHYSANFTSMIDLIAYLTENCCQGVPCAVPAGVACATC
jgi:ArsR family transcriptional regulator, arsenate/arsenite/antimonite-responsive transcriptional repressor